MAETVALSAPEGDRAGQAIGEVLDAMAQGEDVPITVRRVESGEVAGLVDSGEAGVGVVDTPTWCTLEDERFFSHRGYSRTGGRHGRQAGVVALLP